MIVAGDCALVTGAGGFIGSAIARALADRGVKVRAFLRPTGARDNLDARFEPFFGDVTCAADVRAAMDGVRFVFHAAADYRLWCPDPAALIRVNVEGARIVMQEASHAGVERIVHTSSAATIAPGPAPSDETRRLPLEQAFGAYKHSKVLAERLVEEMAVREKLPAVIVNPTAPLGPGDVRPTPTGRIILEAIHGRMPAFVDTGLDIAHVDDVAQGHLLALERGVVGERYLLGGDNVSLRDILFETARSAGTRPPLMRLPRAPLTPLAYASEALARITGREPLLTVEGLRLSAAAMYFDDGKARRDLGYVSRPYAEAIHDAIVWFRSRSAIATISG